MEGRSLATEARAIYSPGSLVELSYLCTGSSYPLNTCLRQGEGRQVANETGFLSDMMTVSYCGKHHVRASDQACPTGLSTCPDPGLMQLPQFLATGLATDSATQPISVHP